VKALKALLVKKRFIQITGEDSQWERLFPTVDGKMFHAWQRPLEESKKNASKN